MADSPLANPEKIICHRILIYKNPLFIIEIPLFRAKILDNKIKIEKLIA